MNLHTVFSDGVFVDSGAVNFCRIPAPTLAETRQITEKTAKRVHRWLERCMREFEDHDAFAQKERAFGILSDFKISLMCRPLWPELILDQASLTTR